MRCGGLFKVSFTGCDVLRNGGREFYNIGTQRLTQRLQKCVEMTETSWKNSFIIAKHA
jgi:hypothetical protein